MNSGGRYNASTDSWRPHHPDRRAFCPRTARGSLDRQRNDRLGRGLFWSHRPLPKYRRQILRAIRPDAYAYTHGYSDSYSHGYIYTNADPQWLLCSQYLPNVWQRCYG